MDLHNLYGQIGYGQAEVPVNGDYDFLQQDYSPQPTLYCGSATKLLPDSIPIIPKREEFIPDGEPSFTHDQYQQGWYPAMASSPFAPDANQPLQLSQPPTPAAECQVSSTISPLNSPFTPQSDSSYSMFQPDPTHYDMTSQPQQPPQEFATLAEFGEYKGMTEEQLVSLSARDLNRLCRDMPEDLVKQLKKRRRTLKNRGYAYNSRVRRVTQKNVLETERDDLKKQLNQLSERCKLLEREADQWKRRCQSLQQAHGSDL